MIDLIEYGFAKTKESPNWTEYEGHGFRITIFDYLYRAFDNSEINRRTFMVNTQRTTSMAHPLSELEQWLKDKKINKK